MLWTLIAADLVGARPIDVETWFSSIQWEQRVLDKGGHATTFIRVTVAPDGRPDNCKVETTSGLADLDAEACAQVMKRGRFKAAKGLDGSPAYGVYRQNVLWADAQSFRYERPVDVELALSRLPKGVRVPNNYFILFAVDANGNKSSCQPPERMNAALAGIACKEVIENYPAIAAKIATGGAVPSVQNVIVSFVAE